MPSFFKRVLDNLIPALTLVIGITISAHPSSASSVSGRIIHDSKVTNSIANDLLNGLDQARMDEIFLISGSDRLSIDVIPFRPVNSENEYMALMLSSELNTFLLAALIQKSQGKFRFHMSRPEMTPRTPPWYQQKTCSDFSGRSKCANRNGIAIEKHSPSKADIAIIGRLVVHKGMGYLSYKAYAPATGIILSATTPRKINIRFSRPSPLTALPSNQPSIGQGEYLEPSRWKIFRLQRDLELLGFRPGRINGYVTRQTRQAIRRYQWHHDLNTDGNVSKDLLKHIRRQVVLSPFNNRQEDSLGRSGV